MEVLYNLRPDIVPFDLRLVLKVLDDLEPVMEVLYELRLDMKLVRLRVGLGGLVRPEAGHGDLVRPEAGLKGLARPEAEHVHPGAVI